MPIGERVMFVCLNGSKHFARKQGVWVLGGVGSKAET